VRTIGISVAAAAAAIALAALPSAAVARDNGLIAYSLGNAEESPSVIYTIEPDGTGHRSLLGPDRRFGGGAAGPQWSPDGRRLLFARYRRNRSGVVGALWYSTASGRRLTRIPLGLGRVLLYGYAWAPDGNGIVFAASHGRPPRRGPMIYTIRLDGAQREPVRRGQRPAWSRDGRHIVFERRFLEQFEPISRIFVVRPDGRGFRRLTGSDADSSPSFSLDGERVVFARDVASLEGDQWRTVDVSGSRDRLVVAHAPNSTDWRNARQWYCAPQWTPDGKRLAAARTDELPSDVPDGPSLVRVVTVTPAGEKERVELTFPHMFVGPYGLCDFSWQPR
jgi:Tol biopolymer transport system component